MTTKKKPAAPQPRVHIHDVHIENNAAPCSDLQAQALQELARAAAANANAIGKIADALKGAEATLGNGIYLTGL